ncbi:MAG: hypothetical protein DMG33_12825 [Acidobacteria bacterium]|nr:MAG: hypothetical protein DMG33_12825 [Acidobacteriota bacterium]
MGDREAVNVVAAVIERQDRRILIGQRRSTDSSPLKWVFPGGKVRDSETPEAALARELREELGVTLRKSTASSLRRSARRGSFRGHSSELRGRCPKN